MKPLLGILLCLLGVGCIQVQELKVPDAPALLTVQGTFAPGEEISVQLTRSVPADTVYVFPPVLNALISIYQDGNLLGQLDSLDHSLEPPVYRSRTPILFQAGSAYELEVIAEGFKEVRALDTLPSPPNAPMLEAVSIRRGPEVSSLYSDVARITLEGEVSFRFPPQNRAMYYACRVKGEAEFYALPNRVETVDSLLETYLFVNFRDTLGVEGFDAYSLTFDPIWKTLPGQEAQLTFNIGGALLREEAPPDSITLELYAFSQSYYRYHQTYNEQQWLRDDPFAEVPNVFSNVTGGYGIWGGYQVKRWRIAVEP